MKARGTRTLQKRRLRQRQRLRSAHEGRLLRDDPRLGMRVASLLPRRMPGAHEPLLNLGTLQQITRFLNGMEYWQVLQDSGMIHEGPASSFARYDGPKFQAGTRVRSLLDEGGYWEAQVLGPVWATNQVRFLIQVTDGHTFASVKVEVGHTLAVLPTRLKLL